MERQTYSQDNCPHLLHFDGPEFKLRVSVTPQNGHREVPAWLERLVQFSGPVPLTLPLQGWVGQVGGVDGGGKIRTFPCTTRDICEIVHVLTCSRFVCGVARGMPDGCTYIGV